MELKESDLISRQKKKGILYIKTNGIEVNNLNLLSIVWSLKISGRPLNGSCVNVAKWGKEGHSSFRQYVCISQTTAFMGNDINR